MRYASVIYIENARLSSSAKITREASETISSGQHLQIENADAPSRHIDIFASLSRSPGASAGRPGNGNGAKPPQLQAYSRGGKIVRPFGARPPHGSSPEIYITAMTGRRIARRNERRKGSEAP